MPVCPLARKARACVHAHATRQARTSRMSTSFFTRRQMLKSAACGFGYLAFADLCARAFAAETAAQPEPPQHYQSPLLPKAPHFPAKAKRVIFLFMQGAPSHVDTFDYKPQLAKNDGKSILGRPLLASPWKFQRYGRSGLYVSELFANTAKHA